MILAVMRSSPTLHVELKKDRKEGREEGSGRGRERERQKDRQAARLYLFGNLSGPRYFY